MEKEKEEKEKEEKEKEKERRRVRRNWRRRTWTGGSRRGIWWKRNRIQMTMVQ